MDMATGQFKQIPISSIASTKYGTSINSINRKEPEKTHYIILGCVQEQMQLQSWETS